MTRLSSWCCRGASDRAGARGAFHYLDAGVCKHLRVLEEAKLVERTVDGRVHRCVLEADPLRQVEKWLAHYRPFWAETLDALANHLSS